MNHSTRFLTQLPTIDDQSPTVVCTITRTGRFHDPRYGGFEITLAMLNQMVDNFAKNVFGQKILVDCSHEYHKGAAAEIIELSVAPNELGGFNLLGKLQFTTYGLSAVKDRGMIYLSAEYTDNFVDNETNQQFGCLLKGAGLTTRPVIKKLDAIQLSESDCQICTDLKIFEEELPVDIFQQKLDELEKRLAEAQVATDTKLSEAVEKLFGAIGKVTPAEPALDPKQLSELVQLEVAKKSAELEAKRLAEQAHAQEMTRHAIELFETTVRAEGKALAEAELTEILKFTAQIDGTLGDKAVKLLAQEKVSAAKQVEINKQLASRGFYRPGVNGAVHIEMDESNSINGLQEEVDKHLAEVLCQKPSGAAKKLADAVLRRYDEKNGYRLQREADAHHQGRNILLAGGTSVASDIAVPSVIERTVARELLYAMNALNFVQSSSLPYAESYQEVYASRDITAADANATMVYEGQSIQNSGVTTRSETFYTQPVKIGFEFTLESQLVNAARQIDYDIFAELVMNATRISQERVDQLVFDDVTNATLAHSTLSVTNETVTGVNGTNTVFPLVNFPVVKPMRDFKANGSQVGATQFPITITKAGAAVLPFDGTKKQPPGTYYIMRYDLGELMFCTELGAVIAPASGQAVVANYSYSKNVTAFDTDYDPAAFKEGEYFNLALTAFDMVESKLRDERYVANVDMALMRKTAQGYFKRAARYDAANIRPGMSLDATGSLGTVGGIPVFSTQSPGIQLGNNLVIVGARNNSRFRVMQPWSMIEPEEMKDSNGDFVGKKHAYGTMFCGVATPTYLRGNAAAMVFYNSDTRKARITI